MSVIRELWHGIIIVITLGHFRCRHTPLPVALPASLSAQYNDDAASVVAGDAPSALLQGVIGNRTMYPYCASSRPLYDEAWTQSTSPWRVAADCVWPIVAEDTRICNDGSDFAFAWWQQVYKCPTGTFCGSNFDWLGNPRCVPSFLFFYQEVVTEDFTNK